MSKLIKGDGGRFGNTAILVLLFALVAVTSAAANSVSYNFSAVVGSKQIQGTLTWNTTLNWVTAYSYSLSGAVGQATCSSLLACGFLTGIFGTQNVSMLIPFRLSGTNYIYLTTRSGVYRSAVSVPEEGFIADLGGILLGLPWLVRRMRLL